jgi:hypothetical protein
MLRAAVDLGIEADGRGFEVVAAEATGGTAAG